MFGTARLATAIFAPATSATAKRRMSGKAASRLGYVPTHRVADGLRMAMPWYVSRLLKNSAE